MSFQSSYFYYFLEGFPEGLRLCRSLFSVLVSMFSCFPMRSCIASFKESKSWHLCLRFVFFCFTERQASCLSLHEGCVFNVFGFSNLLVMYFVRNLRSLSFTCVNLSMYELN